MYQCKKILIVSKVKPLCLDHINPNTRRGGSGVTESWNYGKEVEV